MAPEKVVVVESEFEYGNETNEVGKNINQKGVTCLEKHSVPAFCQCGYHCLR